MSRRRPPPRGPQLRRRKGYKTSPPVILVVCEGHTEKRCLDELRGRWRIPSLKVELDAKGGVPSTVVRRAKERRSEYGRKVEDRPETWVVFDRDEHPCWQRAIDQATALKMKLGISNPCAELWGVLLHQDQTAHIERDKAQSLLKEIHPGYDHGRNPYLDVETVAERIDHAYERAEAILKAANKLGEDEYRNPTTRFHLLVKRLRSIS